MASRLADLLPRLNERDRRLALATEAKSWGRGGIAAVHRATGASASTIRRGVKELLADVPRNLDRRVRAPGGGRKKAEIADPELLGALDSLIEPATRGDPESPLRWTTKSTRLRTGRTGRRCELSRWLVTPFGGRLRKIHIQSRVQARYLRKHGFSPGSQDRILALADLACSSLPNVLVSGPRYGVGFRSTSRRRAYRNSVISMTRHTACSWASSEAPHAEGRIETSPGAATRPAHPAQFRSTSRRRAYRNPRDRPRK